MRPRRLLRRKIVMAETERFRCTGEADSEGRGFRQRLRARSIAACLLTAEDYVRESRERGDGERDATLYHASICS